jgi:hypothetical protein
VTSLIWPRRLSLLGVSLCAGCSFFSGQPPLPRHTAIEATVADEKFIALVQEADIIYFPSESVALSRRSETAWKLLEALERTGNSFALGWDLIGDEENYRGFLAEAKKADAQILALRVSTPLVAQEIAPGFEPPPGDFERFAQRGSSRGVSELKLRGAYERAILAEEFAATKIAGYFREHRNEKILVFVRHEHLGANHGVAYFVAQKTKARQLVLEPQAHPTARSQLLAGNGARLWGRLGARRFEIVNGSPVTGGNER